MTKTKIDINKILANFFVAFFSALAAATALNVPNAFLLAFGNAVIIGGSAAALEFKKQTDGKGIKKVASLAFLF
jgi:hypothetical protein